jgi:rhodanese-related sulfurtransferase
MFAVLMGLKSISCGEVMALLQQEQITVIDVNDRTRWLAARVPSARNLDPAAFVANELPADKNATLIFYCSGYLCRKAPNAARRAKAFGYKNVHVMSAGISGWLGAALPVESGAERDDPESVELVASRVCSELDFRRRPGHADLRPPIAAATAAAAPIELSENIEPRQSIAPMRKTPPTCRSIIRAWSIAASLKCSTVLFLTTAARPCQAIR